MKPITNLALGLFFLIITATNAFAGSPLKGVDVKLGHNPGGGVAAKMVTNDDGSFSTHLAEGEYTLSVDMIGIKNVVGEIIKSKYTNSNYEFDGSGIEIYLDKSSNIKVINQRKSGSIIFLKDGEAVIIIPKGGATLSGKLSWNEETISQLQQYSNENADRPKHNSNTTRIKITREWSNFSLNLNGGSTSSQGVSGNARVNPNASIEWVWNNIGIGVDAGFFSTSPNFNFGNYVAPFKNKGFTNITNVRNNWSSIYLLVGPQYTFALAKSTSLTLSVKGGITFNKAPNFTAIDTGSAKTEIADYKDPEDMTTRKAFTVKPGIVFNYWLNQHWGFNVNMQYLLQTGQSEFATGYRDLSKVDFTAQSDKLREEILNSPKVIVNTKGPDKFLSFGVGINYMIRAAKIKSHSNQTNNRSAKGKGKSHSNPLDAAKIKSHSNQTNN